MIHPDRYKNAPDGHPVSPHKLPDGTWGIVSEFDLEPDKVVTVVTQSGKRFLRQLSVLVSVEEDGDSKRWVWKTVKPYSKPENN